jgi:hypothetical protein
VKGGEESFFFGVLSVQLLLYVGRCLCGAAGAGPSLRKTILTGIIEEQSMEDRVDFKVLYLKPVVYHGLDCHVSSDPHIASHHHACMMLLAGHGRNMS